MDRRSNLQTTQVKIESNIICFSVHLQLELLLSLSSDVCRFGKVCTSDQPPPPVIMGFTITTRRGTRYQGNKRRQNDSVSNALCNGSGQIRQEWRVLAISPQPGNANVTMDHHSIPKVTCAFAFTGLRAVCQNSPLLPPKVPCTLHGDVSSVAPMDTTRDASSVDSGSTAPHDHVLKLHSLTSSMGRHWVGIWASGWAWV